MGLFVWKPEYSVGVHRMDNDHRKLFRLLDALHDAIKQGRGDETIFRIVQELMDYTSYHFRAEEALLNKSNYKDYLRHKQAHLDFEEKLHEFRREIEKGNGIFVVNKVFNTVRDWLTQHILKVDKQYEAHLLETGMV